MTFTRCPFCGERPFALDVNTYRCQIFCRCGASFRYVFEKSMDLDSDIDYAMKRWNRRTDVKAVRTFPGSDAEFRACPICGGLKLSTSSDGGNLRIVCNCGLSLKISCSLDHTDDNPLDDLAAVWNRRVGRG